MTSEIVLKNDKNLIITWEKEGVGFGQLIFAYDKELGRFIVDSECMNISHILEVFEALNKKEYK